MISTDVIRDSRRRVHYAIVHLGNHWRLQVALRERRPILSVWRCDQLGIRRTLPRPVIWTTDRRPQR